MLPISKQEVEFLLASLNEYSIELDKQGRWTTSRRLLNIRQKLQVNINRYEEVN